MKHTILYIDDEVDNLTVFKLTFGRDYDIITAESAKAGISALREKSVHLIIADYKMPEMNGIDLFKQTMSEFPDVNRILLTAYSESSIAIKSINEAQVFSFVSKPWNGEELRAIIDSALVNYDLKIKNRELIENLTSTNNQLEKANKEIRKLKNNLELENNYLKNEIETEHSSESMVGSSPSFKNVLTKIEQVARLTTTVLIQGETGTGKELVSRLIHKLSLRNSKSFVKLNCAALPASLVESELFGYEKGAFTGAAQSKRGLFEVADGGTIFLDEIGEVPIEMQSKLLRVLQDGEFYRVGGAKPMSVDVRVVAATNRVLEAAIEKGEFRSDLYYRLNVFPIKIPPLRDRVDDIPMLIKYFISKYERKLGIHISEVPDEMMKMLVGHSWPGNIRELEAVIERSMILSTQGVLNLYDWTSSEVTAVSDSDGLSLEELEKRHIIHVLNTVSGKISGKGGAAEMLKLNPNTLRSKMTKLGIKF